MNEPESLLPAVEIIAGRVWKKYGLTLSGFMEFDDLYQHGVLTMYRIAHRYNPESPASFKTYMGTRVYGAMLDRIFNDPTIPIYKPSRRGARARLVPLPDESTGAASIRTRPWVYPIDLPSRTHRPCD